MEIGRHAEDVGDAPSSIQLLNMPWSNSRKASQDPCPLSRDSMHSGGGGFRSSVSRGFQDDTDYGFSTPICPRQEHGGHSQGTSTEIIVDHSVRLAKRITRE